MIFSYYKPGINARVPPSRLGRLLSLGSIQSDRERLCARSSTPNTSYHIPYGYDSFFSLAFPTRPCYLVFRLSLGGMMYLVKPDSQQVERHVFRSRLSLVVVRPDSRKVYPFEDPFQYRQPSPGLVPLSDIVPDVLLVLHSRRFCSSDLEASS